MMVPDVFLNTCPIVCLWKKNHIQNSLVNCYVLYPSCIAVFAVLKGYFAVTAKLINTDL